MPHSQLDFKFNHLEIGSILKCHKNACKIVISLTMDFQIIKFQWKLTLRPINVQHSFTDLKALNQQNSTNMHKILIPVVLSIYSPSFQGDKIHILRHSVSCMGTLWAMHMKTYSSLQKKHTKQYHCPEQNSITVQSI